jgi:hypothetical protein
MELIMILSSSFLDNYLIDIIILLIVLLFFITIIFIEIRAKKKISKSYSEKFLNISDTYALNDKRYRNTDLLVESFENDLIDEIDKSIKDLEIDAFNEKDYLIDYSEGIDENEDNTLFREDDLTPMDPVFSRYELKDLWVNITEILKKDFNVDKIALLEKDEDGLFNIIKNMEFDFETVEKMKFTEFDKFYNNFFKMGLNLYIIKDVFANKTLFDMFSTQDRENIGELLFLPLNKNNEIIGILCCSRKKGLPVIDTNLIKNKILVYSTM